MTQNLVSAEYPAGYLKVPCGALITLTAAQEVGIFEAFQLGSVVWATEKV